MTEDVRVGQTVFVTKYALSKGIQPLESRPIDNGGIEVWLGARRGWWSIYDPRTWATTREEAAAQANAMRDRKIKSVEKQLARLRALTF